MRDILIHRRNSRGLAQFRGSQKLATTTMVTSDGACLVDGATIYGVGVTCGRSTEEMV